MFVQMNQPAIVLAVQSFFERNKKNIYTYYPITVIHVIKQTNLTNSFGTSFSNHKYAVEKDHKTRTHSVCMSYASLSTVFPFEQ